MALGGGEVEVLLLSRITSRLHGAREDRLRGQAWVLDTPVRFDVDREGDGSVLAVKVDREVESGWSLALSTWRFHGPDLASLRGDGYVAVSLRRAWGPWERRTGPAPGAPFSGPRARGAP